ncbi:thiamine pyrophosphate-binding protein [Candidatus Laterigemmans baculatus]|uniref:thiamine pyrophosphate-binding protein n=1 Tax=Candidatus Laterigemmans baculatus TaxID=2770505 RepID=UPI0013D98D61|nr:thiamine pyrophosphate-binding protein [Candidatus Laterigemmans baculatus]
MNTSSTLAAATAPVAAIAPVATAERSLRKTGQTAVLDQLRADGIQYIFGNPGTVEQGLLDSLWDYPDLKYVLTLQETIAVMIADGYARATQTPTVVQIHSTPGLGNSIGALYQAMRGHAPLVVIGGDAGAKYQAMDAQMAGDLVGMARPVTKWSTMVTDPASTLRVLRRAIKIAATPPMGPVYVCLPQDVLDSLSSEPVRPTVIPSTRVMPDPALLAEAAEMLAAAEKPMIFMGDGVAYSKAEAELARVAELLGAEVWAVDSGELNMSFAHPLHQGSTGHMFGESSRSITTRGDVNLIVGTYMLPEVFPSLDNIFAPGAKSIHIDLNAYEIAKNHPVDLGLVSDPKLTLGKLAEVLDGKLSENFRRAAAARTAAMAEAKQLAREAELQKDIALRDRTPLHFATFMEELARQVPADVVLFDEALTNSPALTRYCTPTDPGSFFQTRGGSLGVGIPGAIGVKLAMPKRTVIGVTGDGGAMYTIQALWSAARHNVDAKFIVCNNRSYRLLQLNIQQYWRENAIPPHDFPLSFDLSKPDIRFAEMAQTMGVPGIRIERQEQIAPAIRQALEHQGPFLLEVIIEGDIHPEMIGVRCGQ